MNGKIKIAIIIQLIICIFFGNNAVRSQAVKSATFNYISPVPGSKYIMPQNNIALRHGEPIAVESLQNFSIQVNGSKSGKIEGRIVLASDSKTIIFTPFNSFAFGEEVQVNVSGGLETKSGINIEQESFTFSVSSALPELPANYFIEKEIGTVYSPVSSKMNKPIAKTETKDNNLPDDFPNITTFISEDLPTDGYYFAAPFGFWGWYPDAKPYLTIIDEHGTPVFYRKIPFAAYDFKKLYNGNIAYYANFNGWYRWVIEDDAFSIVDDWGMQNGYWTDWHEFQLLSKEGHEGHALVMAYDPQIVDMSEIVPGGNPNAIVNGWVIQEQDVDKNVVFQWRSWDHFLITDAHDLVDLTDSIIDPIHGNAIEVYSDSELLLSARNLNEITKISRNTGDIIWRLGGKNNMFEFVNDTLGFSVQHDCRRLDNGNISIFDNGTYHPQPFSSVIEYELDEIDHTAILIKRYRHNPDVYGSIMGNGQETETGNMVAGWGSLGEPAITEFSPEGDILAEINIESINYRAYRYPWETSYFSLNKDTLQYGYIWQEDTLQKIINAYNNSNQNIQLTSYFSVNDAFSVENEFPITILQGQHVQLNINFEPDTIGNFESMLTINSDINSDTLVQRIAQQVYLIGNATSGQSVNQHDGQGVFIYPNPTSDEINIQFSEQLQVSKIQLCNIYGSLILERKLNGEQKIILDLSPFPNGVYFVYLIEKYSLKPKFYKIIKY